MFDEHWFWGSLTLATLAWYATITVYVGIRGALDIRHMLQRLQRDDAAGSQHAMGAAATSPGRESPVGGRAGNGEVGSH